MSDDKKVVNLADERVRRDHEEGHRLHEAGSAFQFMPFEYDPDTSLGLINGEMPISILTDTVALKGICMTREDARKLGHDLLGACDAQMPEDIA